MLENYVELNMPPKDHQRQLQYATAEMYEWYTRRLANIRQVRTEHQSAQSQIIEVERDTENGKRLRQIIRK